MKKIWIIIAACAVTACATNNIYFPSASATKAADSIIEDVWKPAQGAK